MEKHYSLKIVFLSLFFIFNLIHLAQANDIYGGELTYSCVANNQYQVELRLYRNCNSIGFATSMSIDVKSSNCSNQTLTLNLLQGYPIDITSLCPGDSSSCSGSGSFGIEEYVYKGLLSLSGCWINENDIELSLSKCCRGSLSTANSNSTVFISTILDNTLTECNNTPSFTNSPVTYFCINNPVSYSQNAMDFDNDSLIYRLVDCSSSSGNSVNYTSPYSGTSPLSSLNGVSIDSTTGLIEFIPTTQQDVIICVKVEEYRNGIKIGEVIRDMQFSIKDCQNTLPVLSGINGTANANGTTGNFNITACANTTIDFNMASFDPNIMGTLPQTLEISWSQNIPNAVLTVDTSTLPNARFQWTPSDNQVGTYQFTATIKDDNCSYIGINSYTYTIHVLENTKSNLNDVIRSCSIGDTINLNPNFSVPLNSNTIINWTPTNSLSDPLGQTTLAFPDSNTTYTIDIQQGNGCANSDTIQILVTNGVGIPTLADSIICSGDMISLDVSPPSVPETTFLNDTIKTIPDGNLSGIYSYINVSSLSAINNLKSVCLTINHPVALDIDAYLIAPNGTVLELTTDNGQFQNVYQNICFSPSAVLPIASSSILPNGSYLPEGNFSTIENNTNGLWKLWISDDGLGFSGNLIEWSISFSEQSHVNYTWTPTTSLSCSNCSSPIANPNTTTTYTVQAVDQYGCSDSTTATLIVEDNIPAPTILNTSFGSNSMSFCWSDNSFNLSYEINIDNAGWISPNGTNGLCHTVSGLSSSQTINVQIRAATTCSSTNALINQQNLTMGNTCLDDAGQMIVSIDTTIIQNNMINIVNYGSQVNFSHSGGNLSSDGNITTPSGFDIPIYLGFPITVSGTTAAAINADPAFTGSFVGTDINGNATIQNSGQYQNTYNSGNPVHLWFAPITLDYFDYQIITENVGSSLECTNLNVSEQVNMVFLNEIKASNFQNPPMSSIDSCSARINVQGGLPEWDASTYNVTIHKIGNPLILATISTPPATHNGSVEFTVPEQGNYEITVQDNNLGYNTFYVSMNSCSIQCVTPLDITSNIASDYNGSPISCHNSQDGIVSASINNGAAPFTFNWSHDTTLTGSTIYNLGAGTYYLSVIDSNGCVGLDTISITSPNPLVSNLVSIPDTNDWDVGTLIASATGGTPPYAYQWDNSLGAPTSDTVFNVTQGAYSITITDANGCFLTEIITVDSIFNSVSIFNKINSFSILPNPTRHLVNIQLELLETAMVGFELLDIRGQHLQAFGQEQLIEKQFQMNLSSYSAGVYLVRLIIDNQVLTRRIVLIK